MPEVGRVIALWRYPVKSMAGEALDATPMSWNGLAGDRRWAFVRDGMARSGFPWLTLRERPDLWRYQPSFVEPERPDASRTVVRTPSGEVLDVTDPALAAELGPGVRVLKSDRGLFDAMPLSLVTTATIAALEDRLGAALDTRRFRPNLIIETTDAFCEDRWVGATLEIGTARIRIDRRDGRCVVVTVDPVTLEPDPAVLKVIAREREAHLGVYGSVVCPGRAEVGDPVVLGRW